MSDDKTEEPTESKLRKAREEGQVAKSEDLTKAASLLGTLIALLAVSDMAAARLRRIVMLGLDFGDGNLPLIDLYRRIGSMSLEALLVFGPMVLAAALFAVLGAAGQIGIVVAMEAVAPKPESIDPAAGLKKLFSVKSLLTFVQMVFKAVTLGVVLWQLILALLPMISGAVYQSTSAIATIGWQAITRMLLIACGLFLVLGPVDYAIQRWQFMKGQRMSKDEVKREHKGEEGDPEIKGKRKQIARENANSPPPSRKAVAGANAVIVNPTHYAIAVRYRPEEGLPRVVAKGMDRVALRIRSMAEDEGVPVFSNPPLARALHKVPQGGAVPEELFAAVAAVLRWVEDIGRKPSGGGAA